MNTDGNTDPRCATCGHKRSEHHYRHPFVGPSEADTIEELTAKLAEVTKERDRLDAAIKRQAGAARTLRECTLSEVQHIKDNERKEYVATRSLDSERDANAILTDEIEAAEQRVATLEAMLPAAYRKGMEAGAKRAHVYLAEAKLPLEQRSEGAHLGLYDAIHALPTPTIEQLKEMMQD